MDGILRAEIDRGTHRICPVPSTASTSSLPLSHAPLCHPHEWLSMCMLICVRVKRACEKEKGEGRRKSDRQMKLAIKESLSRQLDSLLPSSRRRDSSPPSTTKGHTHSSDCATSLTTLPPLSLLHCQLRIGRPCLRRYRLDLQHLPT